jgi:pSer/pThr/pTyr-binding forkhead associated (FHA) protein
MSVSILMLFGRVALVVCLYGFLAAILILLWRDVRAAAMPGHSGPPQYSIRRLRGDGTTERVFPLQKDSCFIGRSPSVEVSLSDETVSVVHARIWRESGQWWIEDLDSRNGTLLNRIPVGKRTVLCAGDRILAGRILLEFHAEAPDPGRPVITEKDLPPTDAQA